MKKSLLLLLLVWHSPMYAQDARSEMRAMERGRFDQMANVLHTRALDSAASGFNVAYYRLALNIDPATEIISGSMTVKAAAQIADFRVLALDLYDNMTVDSVRANEGTLNFTHSNDKLNITLQQARNPGEFFEVTVYYHGHPTTTGFASFAFSKHDNASIISTLSEPYGAPTWWPCNDDPADKADSVDVIVTVPEQLYAVSNGLLVNEVANGDGTRTYFWAERYPISTYLVSLAISNYARFSDFYHYSATDSMPVQFFVYPEDLAAAGTDFSVTVPMIEYFSSVFGQYPFIKERYGMAEFQWHGAMEHQTCTSYGANLITGTHAYDWVVAHELAHQWFGDLVTLASWSNIWLNEGFATFSEALWQENLGGLPAYLDYMKGLDAGFFPTTVFVYDTTSTATLFSYTVYDKGAWVLHMLRHVIGDETFFRALRSYRGQFAFGNATTDDFRDVCEAEYGHDLDWFFQQWVYDAYRPDYEYSWYHSSVGDQHSVILEINQVQTNTGLFKVPLDVVLTSASAETTIVVRDSLATQRFHLTSREPITNLSIDPDGWVLKNIKLVPTSVSDVGQPERFALYPNYPNPFNAETVIEYNLSRAGHARLAIHNLLGNLVRRLVDASQVEGHHSVKWDGRDDAGRALPSGVYFYKLELDDSSLPARKMLLLQ